MVLWIVAAWDKVTPATISNCWHHTRITPHEWGTVGTPVAAELNCATAQGNLPHVEPQELELATLITEFHSRISTEVQVLSVADYVNASDEQQIEGMLTDSDLIARYQQLDANLSYAETVDNLLGGGEEDVCSDEDKEEVEESKVTLKQAKETTSLLLRFFEQNETIEPEWEVTITKLQEQLEKLALARAQPNVQVAITSYFKLAILNRSNHTLNCNA